MLLSIFRGPGDIEAVDTDQLYRKPKPPTPDQVRRLLGFAGEPDTQAPNAATAQPEANRGSDGLQPWLLTKPLLGVNQFLSFFHVRVSGGGHGAKMKAWAKKKGRLAEAVQLESNNGLFYCWPVEALCQFFDGQVIGGILIDGERFLAARERAIRDDVEDAGLSGRAG